MQQYSVEPRARKYYTGYIYWSFLRKYKKQLLNAGLDATKKVVHYSGEFGHKTADTVTKSRDDKIEKKIFH